MGFDGRVGFVVLIVCIACLRVALVVVVWVLQWFGSVVWGLPICLIFGFDCGFLGLIEDSVTLCVFWICVFQCLVFFGVLVFVIRGVGCV